MSETPTAAGATPATGATPDAATTAAQPGATPATGATPVNVPSDGDQPIAASATPAPDDEEPRDPKSVLAAYKAAQDNVRALRQEVKKRDADLKELAQLREERTKAEDARLSDIDRATKRAAQLEAELKLEREERQDRTNRYEVQIHAARLGIVDPEAAVKLLDWGTLEYAEDGAPKDLDRALKLLLKDRPYLAGQAPAAGSAAGTSPTNGATRTGGPGQRLYSQHDLADRAFYSAHRDDIVAAYREGRIVD